MWTKLDTVTSFMLQHMQYTVEEEEKIKKKSLFSILCSALDHKRLKNNTANDQLPPSAFKPAVTGKCQCFKTSSSVGRCAGFSVCQDAAPPLPLRPPPRRPSPLGGRLRTQQDRTMHTHSRGFRPRASRRSGAISSLKPLKPTRTPPTPPTPPGPHHTSYYSQPEPPQHHLITLLLPWCPAPPGPRHTPSPPRLSLDPASSHTDTETSSIIDDVVFSLFSHSDCQIIRRWGFHLNIANGSLLSHRFFFHVVFLFPFFFPPSFLSCFVSLFLFVWSLFLLECTFKKSRQREEQRPFSHFSLASLKGPTHQSQALLWSSLFLIAFCF